MTLRTVQPTTQHTFLARNLLNLNHVCQSSECERAEGDTAAELPAVW